MEYGGQVGSEKGEALFPRRHCQRMRSSCNTSSCHHQVFIQTYYTSPEEWSLSRAKLVSIERTSWVLYSGGIANMLHIHHHTHYNPSPHPLQPITTPTTTHHHAYYNPSPHPLQPITTPTTTHHHTHHTPSPHPLTTYIITQTVSILSSKTRPTTACVPVPILIEEGHF